MNEKKPILLTGIKPTGDIHIGNYFGAIKPAVDLLKDGNYTSYVFIADYHALNFIQDASEMRRLTRELAMTYIAAGLDPEKVVLFKQSDVSAHTELAWIFDTITTMPYLERAHAYKDAEAKNKEISVGTFNYPMLMAADILLYDATIVPVGQDQKQHIEYARDTAEKFNRVFKTDALTLPEPHIMEEVAVVPGTDGRKMSKSYGNTIPLFGTEEEIAKRVMGIVTDSSGGRPENVYAIHKLVKTEDELTSLYEENQGNYKILKETLLQDLMTALNPIRAYYDVLKNSPEKVDEILHKGGKLASRAAGDKMAQIRRIIGVTN
jgi:tryptophanyl-tRNA synthetase